MSGLPTQIPQQSVPLIQDNASNAKPQYLDVNWYLWAYNISQAVLGTGQGGGTTPASPFDFLDAANLLAQGADIPQAYRRIENLAAYLSVQSQPDGADIARLRHDLTNALLLAVTPALPDTNPTAQPVQVVTVGASPFAYTALFNGALVVSGGVVSAISITRQGVAVAAGVTVGMIPVRRLDKVTVTYSVLPTISFLPS